MRSSLLFLLTLAPLLLWSTLASAGTIKDTAAIVWGTMITGGLYLPYKLFGVIRRCRSIDNYQMCAVNEGCSWKYDPDQSGRGKCRADGALFALRKFYHQRDAKCRVVRVKDSCKHIKACYWSRHQNTCKARWLNAFRETRHLDKNLEEYQRAAWSQPPPPPPRFTQPPSPEMTYPGQQEPQQPQPPYVQMMPPMQVPAAF